MLLFSIIVYIALTLLVGFLASKKVRTSGDFMLAGRSLPIVLSTSALFATWFGSETVFGASSRFLNGGLFSVIEDPFGAALCLVLFGMFFAGKLYRMNLLTLGDFFKVRFGRKTEIIATVFMVPAYFGYTAGQLVALALVLKVVAGLELWQGVVLSGFVVTFYTFIGGMWAISITDFFQSIIIVLGLVVLCIVLTGKSGGVMNVLQAVPPSDFKFLPRPGFTEWISYLAAWSVLGLGSIPSQDVFQRAMASGSSRVAIRSCYYAAALYLTVAMLPLFISLCVKYLYPDEINGDTQLTLPIMVLKHTAVPIQILFFGSLLSAIMSTTSSSILAPAALMAENLVKPLLKETPTDHLLLNITRMSILAFSTVAIVMACIRSDIYELVGESSILSLVSLFSPLALGLYWKGASSTGAIVSMVLGIATWWVAGMFPMKIPSLVPGLMVSFVAMIVGSLLWPERHPILDTGKVGDKDIKD